MFIFIFLPQADSGVHRPCLGKGLLVGLTFADSHFAWILKLGEKGREGKTSSSRPTQAMVSPETDPSSGSMQFSRTKLMRPRLVSPEILLYKKEFVQMSNWLGEL